MPNTDRTNEFRACVDSIRSRASRVDLGRTGNRDAQVQQRLLQGPARKQSKSDFARMASSIGKDISSTTTKLDKLAQCTRHYHDCSFSLRLVSEFTDEDVELISGKTQDSL